MSALSLVLMNKAEVLFLSGLATQFPLKASNHSDRLHLD